MQLRNRRTGEHFEFTSGGNKKPGFFEQKPAVLCKEIHYFIEDVKKRLPESLSSNEKKQIISKLYKDCEENKASIDQLLSNSEKMAELFDKKEDKRAPQATKSPELIDFIKKVGGMTLAAHLPLSSLLVATMLPAVAAQMSSYVVHEGRPSDGIDLCSEVIFGCIQGYVTHGADSWTLDLPQFNRIVSNVSGSLDPLASESLQLKDCMSVDKVGGMVVDALEQGQNPMKSVVPLSGGRIWHQLDVSGQASQIPVDAANALKDNFMIESQKCMDDWARLKYQAIIAGSVIGGVAAIALCVCACYYAQKKYEERNEGALSVRL